MNIKIKELSEYHTEEFVEKLTKYFEKLKTDSIKSSEDFIQSTFKLIEKHAIEVAVVELDNQLIGFSTYQIDSFKSDWNERGGYGFVREFFIEKDYRKQGYGKMLFNYVEKKLQEKNAKGIYLHSKNSNIKFWTSIGFDVEEKPSKTGLTILSK